MKRKMIGAAAGYLSGLFFASFFAENAVPASICCAAVVIICGIRRKFRAADYICIIACFAVAFSVSRIYTSLCYDKLISLDGSEGSFRGKVTDYVVHDGGKASYILDGRINGNTSAKVLFYTDDLDAEYGDIIVVDDCIFSEIKGDYLFDSKNYYRSRHVFLEISGKDQGIIRTGTLWLRNKAASLREWMISRYRQIMGDEAGGFLGGMIFGEKHYIADGTRDSLYRCGIGHVLAVSGLHVTIIAAAAMALMKRAGVNKYISFAVVNLLFLFIITAANYPVSAIRAALMLEIMYAAPLFRRQNDSFNSLAAAVMIICVIDPYSVYSSGFILSVSGTFGIAVFGPYMAAGINGSGRSSSMLRSFVIAACTSLSVMPASLYFYDEVSLISPLSNILLIPMCSLAMLIGLIFTVTGGIFTPLLMPVKLIIRSVLAAADAVSSFSGARIPKTDMTFVFVLIASAVLIPGIYLFRPERRTVVTSLAVASALCAAVFTGIGGSRRDKLTVAFLGRKNPGAVVISCDDMTSVIDLNGNYKNPQYVKKYLAETGTGYYCPVFITKKRESMYASYMTQLRLYSPVLQKAECKNLRFASDEVILEYDSGGTVISFGSSTVKIQGSSIFINDGYFISAAGGDNGITNFEITLSREGEYEIRSL